MGASSYRFYYDNRPIKILFLITSDEPVKGIKNIITYNQKLWGGRYNQIFTVEKNQSKISFDSKIESDIKSFDPDIVLCSFKISSNIRKTILSVSSPLSIESIKPRSSDMFSFTGIGYPIIIQPDVENINFYDAPFSQSNIVNFLRDNLKNPSLKTFFDINFGGFDERMMGIQGIKKIGRLESYEISNYTDFDNFIDTFTATYFAASSIFPIQLCSQPMYIGKHTRNSSDEDFFVFLGNDKEDISNNWNRARYVPNWKQRYINQLYINEEVFAKTKHILKFIERLSNPSGTSGKRIHFLSNSLSEVSIKLIVDDKIVKTGFRIMYSATQKPQRDYSTYNHYNVERMNYLELTDIENEILLKKPKTYGSLGNYICDTYIEYNLTEARYVNQKDWWQFPRKNYIANSIISNAKSRVNQDHNISIILNSSENISFAGEPVNANNDFCTLKMKLPSDRYDFFRTIFLLNDDFYSSSERGSEWNFGDISHSIEGRKMMSIIGLFGGLDALSREIGDNPWNRVFEIISFWYQDRLNELQKRLKKELPLAELSGVTSGNYEDVINKISESTKKEMAKITLSEKKELTFEAIYKIVSPHYLSYMPDDDKVRNRVLRELQDFSSNRIFTVGLKPTCKKCSHKNWLPLKDLDTKVACNYCNNIFYIDPELDWHYRLNELVIKFYEGTGGYPVVLALAKLSNFARNSFIYYGSLDIFNKNNKPITDVDIVCMKDGKLIIGEAKTSKKGFKEKDFNAIFEVAKKIEPDIVIFTSLDGNNQFINGCITKMNQDFKKLGMLSKAEWLDLD